MQRNDAWKDIANLRTKQLNSCTMSQLHVLTTINSRNKKRDLLENCQKFAHQKFWTVCLARNGRPDILWSVNKLARAITKGPRAWHTLSTFDLVHSSHMWIQTILSCGKHCTTMPTRIISRFWFYWRTGRLEIKIRRILCMFGSHRFVPISWMCKKQTSVSHCSSGSCNNFSWCRFTHGWYSSSRSLGFGYWSVPFLPMTNSVINKGLSVQGTLLPNTSSNKRTRNQAKAPTKHDIAVLYVFEDNEAVIQRIIEGRSRRTMRHVSRTHRVSLDWLFDRINLDPKIQIRYIDTKTPTRRHIEQKGISAISALSAALRISFSLTSCTRTMAKRMQEQKEDNRILAKSKPTAVDLAVSVSTSSSSVNSPIASKSPGILKASSRQMGYSGKPDVRSKRNSNTDAASSFSRMAKGCICGGLHRETCRNRKKIRNLWIIWGQVCTGKRVAPGYEGYPGNPGTPGNSEESENEGVDTDCPPQSPYFNKLRAAHGESFLDREPKIRSQSDGSPRCEHGGMVYISICYSSSFSSSWARLHRKSAMYQESTLEVCETTISNDWDVDHGSKRKLLEKPRLTGSSICGKKHLCCVIELFVLWYPQSTSFLLGAVFGRHQSRTSSSLERLVLWKIIRSWSSRETWDKHCIMVLWHGRSCEETCGKILRTCE